MAKSYIITHVMASFMNQLLNFFFICKVLAIGTSAKQKSFCCIASHWNHQNIDKTKLPNFCLFFLKNRENIHMPT